MTDCGLDVPATGVRETARFFGLKKPGSQRGEELLVRRQNVLLVLFCVLLNVLPGALVMIFRFPFFLDTIGTFLAALLAGPWFAMLVGLSTNLILGGVTQSSVSFVPVSMAVALTAGFLGDRGYFRSFGRVLLSGCVVTLVVTLVATPIYTYMFSGATGAGADRLIFYFNTLWDDLLKSVLGGVIWINLMDKDLSAVLAWLIVRKLPEKVRAAFPYSCPVREHEKKETL